MTNETKDMMNEILGYLLSFARAGIKPAQYLEKAIRWTANIKNKFPEQAEMIERYWNEVWYGRFLKTIR